ncbi:uncharacterized protein NEPG_00426 [Nematocida parisii ERTm1]|uniref:uncharacterized protein n=1 Tax=Nematocida parisii (strain ERTm1 / ATCC PRA-289) TaxID=881290 RepID=UPI000264B7A1|nr:uncharacterized protein NEPG_00426 [Nematocida parisii ERTm1]EIJ94901.1 hypothetical protein NEPG_00426 [Nematocida parisii ERTm1]|eukprot:XP_013058257.1 hypothetical protein NEPG_00426 [Nematocida parisii ERTm1]
MSVKRAIKTSSKTKSKYMSKKTIAIITGIAFALAYALFKYMSVPFDLDNLEYVISIPSDAKNRKVNLNEPLSAFNIPLNARAIEYVEKKYVIVQSMHRGRLVASVFVFPYHYRNSEDSPSGLVLGFEIYNMYVSPRYRGKGVSINHLYRTFMLLKKIYQADNGIPSYIVLHVSPIDKDMEKAYALYRTNGFVHGLFTENGPYSLRKRSEVFLERKSLESVIENSPYYSSEYTGERSASGDKFLTMYTDINTFLRSAKINAYSKNEYNRHKERAARLKESLLKRFIYTKNG